MPPLRSAARDGAPPVGLLGPSHEWGPTRRRLAAWLDQKVVSRAAPVRHQLWEPAVLVWCGVVWCGVVWCGVPKALLPKGKGRDVYPRVQVNGLGCVCCVRAVCKCVVA